MVLGFQPGRMEWPSDAVSGWKSQTPECWPEDLSGSTRTGAGVYAFLGVGQPRKPLFMGKANERVGGTTAAVRSWCAICR